MTRHRGGSDEHSRASAPALPLMIMISCVFCACDQGITRQQWEVIETWLTCEHCQNDELAGVLRLGNPAVPILSQTLICLPPEYMESLERRAGAAWKSIPGAVSDSSAFVEYHALGILAKTQLRSARALGALGAWDAVRIGVDSTGAGHYGGDVGLELQRYFFEAGPEVGYYLNDTAIARVVETGGGTVENMTVVLVRCDQAPQAFSPPMEGRCHSAGPVYRTGQTDAHGMVFFPDLEEGIYQIFPDTLGTPYSQVTPASRLLLLVGDADTETGEFNLSM